MDTKLHANNDVLLYVLSVQWCETLLIGARVSALKPGANRDRYRSTSTPYLTHLATCLSGIALDFHPRAYVKRHYTGLPHGMRLQCKMQCPAS